jgi:hypothetical protein
VGGSNKLFCSYPTSEHFYNWRDVLNFKWQSCVFESDRKAYRTRFYSNTHFLANILSSLSGLCQISKFSDLNQYCLSYQYWPNRNNYIFWTLALIVFYIIRRTSISIKKMRAWQRNNIALWLASHCKIPIDFISSIPPRGFPTSHVFSSGYLTGEIIFSFILLHVTVCLVTYFNVISVSIVRVGQRQYDPMNNSMPCYLQKKTDLLEKFVNS